MLQLLVVLFISFGMVNSSGCPAAAAFADPTATMIASMKGKCQTYQTHLPDGSLSFCNGIVDYPFFMPAAAPHQAYLDNLAEASMTKGKAKNGILLSLLPPQCSLQLKRAVCLAVFQACELVDLYFMDSSCSTPCSACGTYDPNDVPPVMSASNLAPAYGSQCAGVASMCIAGPGKVPGLGHMTWAAAKESTGFVGTMVEFCASRNMFHDTADNSCKVTIARTPCKGTECDPLSSTDVGYTVAGTNAVCPLISKNFALELPFLMSNTTDPVEIAQLNNSMNVQLEKGRSSIPLLKTFKLKPDCDQSTNGKTYDFSVTYFGEFKAYARMASVGKIIETRANAYSGFANCECTSGNVLNITSGEIVSVAPICAGTTCNDLKTRTSRCHSGGSRALANPSVRFTKNSPELNPICKEAITSLNQPSETDLAGFKLAFGLSSIEEAKGAFYVPPMPGLPVLASGSQVVDLCRFPNVLNPAQVFTGNDSYSCIIAKVKSSQGLIPRVVKQACRKRFFDLLCSSAHMKLESKSLCLVAGGCNPSLSARADHKIPFSFALPRFPRRSMCEAFKTDCSGFIKSLTPIQQGLVASAFNCTGKIMQTCAGNNLLRPTSAWSCSSSLNGLDSYPESVQVLANLADYGLPGFDSVGASSSSNESLVSFEEYSTCECPAPLVVPQDPHAHTITPNVCCAEVCEGTLFVKSDVDIAINIVRSMAVLSFVGSFLILVLALWKRSPSLVFFMSFALMNIALSLLIPSFYGSGNPRQVWCKDNSQHYSQGDGGMCLYQSIWFCYWVMCAACFWVMLSFDTYQHVAKNVSDTTHLHKYYHAFAWLYPLIVLIVMLGTQTAGYEPRSYWCLFAEPTEETKATKEAVELGLFYGSLVALWLLGCGFINVAIMAKVKGHADANVFKEYKSRIIFVLAYNFVIAIMWGFKYIAYASQPAVRQGAQDWVSCLLGNFVAGIPDPASSPMANNSLVQPYGLAPNTGCGSSYPRAPGGFALTGLALTPIALQGFILFSIFAMSYAKGELGQSSKYDMGGKGIVDVNTEGKTNPQYKNNALSTDMKV